MSSELVTRRSKILSRYARAWHRRNDKRARTLKDQKFSHDEGTTSWSGTNSAMSRRSSFVARAIVENIFTTERARHAPPLISVSGYCSH